MLSGHNRICSSAWRKVSRGTHAGDQALCKAQAELTRAETLKEVGEWLETNHNKSCNCGDEVLRIAVACIEALKQGKMPGEE